MERHTYDLDIDYLNKNGGLGTLCSSYSMNRGSRDEEIRDIIEGFMGRCDQNGYRVIAFKIQLREGTT